MADCLSDWNNDLKFYDESIRKNPDAYKDCRLPKADKRNILITSALPYVNNVPHLGNIIGCVLSGDVFSRFCKIMDYQSLHICGTDEYGTATEMKALKEGMTPQEICEKYFHLHKQIYEWFNIDFDNFGRTSTPNQTEIAQDIFKKLQENGYTSIGSLDQLHCGKCDKFLADRFVSGTCPDPACAYPDARGDQCDKCGKLIDAVELVDPKCHLCETTPVVKNSKHIFLQLDKLSPQVAEFIDKSTSAEGNHWSSNAVAIAKSWIKAGLEKRCITRDLKWGTPVPLEGFENKVFYVWYDAPIGYLSITKTLLGDDWTKWWKNPDNVELYHFVGKDNVAFHSVMFPACELGTGEPFTMVKNLCATEYLNYEDQKFSKSRGTGVFGDSVSEVGIPADVWRFYLVYVRPETQDTAFSWDDFMAKVNSELNANLGNFVQRSLKFLFSYFDGVVPEIEFTVVEHELVTALNADLKEYTDLLENVHLRDALIKILAITRKGNQYLQSMKPWDLIKTTENDKAGDEGRMKRAKTVIAMVANISVLLSTLMYPFMPVVSKQIRTYCNIDEVIQLPKKMVQFVKTGHKINEPFPLFANLDPIKIAEWKRTFGSSPSSDQPVAAEQMKAAPKKAQKDVKKMKDNKKPAGNGVAAAVPPAIVEIQSKLADLVKKASTVQTNEAKIIFDQLENHYNVLKKLFDGYAGSWEKHEVGTLLKENTTLSREVEALTKKLVDIEIAAGVKQIPVPDRSGDAKAAKEETVVASVSDTKPKAEKKDAKEPKKKAPAAAPVDAELDMGHLDLRVGRIIEAKKHPDADALYLETIDVGEENPRTVISGLVKHVPLEDMQNRLVVCLCNLKPSKMRGITSEAMVMCASSPEKVEIMEVDPSAKPGDKITCGSFVHRPVAQITPKNKVWELLAPDFLVAADGKGTFRGQPLLVEGQTPMTAPTLRNVNIK